MTRAEVKPVSSPRQKRELAESATKRGTWRSRAFVARMAASASGTAT
jgi:hypothetical protein